MKKILVHTTKSGAWCTAELTESIKDALIYFGFDAVSEYRNRGISSGYDFVIQVGYGNGFHPHTGIYVFVETDMIGLRKNYNTILDYTIFTRSLHPFDYKEDLTSENIYYCPVGYSKHYDTTIPHTDLRDSFCMGRDRYGPARGEFRKRYNLWTTDTIVAGKERDELIVTSKININPRPYENYWFTTLHASLVVFKGKLLMQDDVGKDDYNFYRPYMILYTEDDFIDKYNYWLTHDKERHEFEQFIYEDLKNNHPFEKYFYAAMGDILEEYR